MNKLGSIRSGQPVIGLREKGNLKDSQILAQQQQVQKFGKIPDMKIEDPEEIEVDEYTIKEGANELKGQIISFYAKGGFFTYSSFHHSFDIVTKAEDGFSYSRKMSLEEAKDFMNEVARQLKDNPKLLTQEANRAKTNMLKSFITWGVSYLHIVMDYNGDRSNLDIEIPNTSLQVGYCEIADQVWVQVYDGKKWVNLEEKDAKEAIKKILDYLPKIVLDSSKGEVYINKSEKFINIIYNRLLKILEYLEYIEKQEKEQSQV